MKEESYLSFKSSLESVARRKQFPLRVMFELTYRCNFRCAYCYLPPSYAGSYKKDELSTAKVKRILDDLAKLGCLHLGFTGGEPFLRRDIFEILDYAAFKGFQTQVYTNASLIDARKIIRLKKIPLHKISINLPALDECVFRQITAISQAKARVFRAMKLLRKNKIPFSVKTCLIRQNQKNIPRIRRWARDNRIDWQLEKLVWPRLDGSREPLRLRIPIKPLGEKSAYKTVNSVCRAGHLLPSDKSMPLFFCGAGSTQAAITPSGEIKLCTGIQYPLYSIGNQPVELSWNKLRRLVVRLEAAREHPCQKCDLSGWCGWCPARSWLNKKNFYSCDYENFIQNFD